MHSFSTYITPIKVNPFGMEMKGRDYEGSKYRYGFNTQEKDDEIYGEGNSTSAEYWQYDARLGRRWNVDPRPRVDVSSYACFGNNPIELNDVKGDSAIIRYKENAGIKALFERAKYYTYKNDGTDKNVKTNSKYLKNAVSALDKIKENDGKYVGKIISDKDNDVTIRNFGFKDQIYKPGVYHDKKHTIRWQFNVGVEFPELNHTMAPFEVLNHELGHAYIDLYYTKEEKNQLEQDFNKLTPEEQYKWSDWNEKEVVEKMEKSLSDKIHPGVGRKKYRYDQAYNKKVKNSISTE